MAAGRLELGRDGRHVDELPDLDGRADRQPVTRSASPIGAWKVRKWAFK